MGIAFIFGLLFFVSIYFYDRVKHQKNVEIELLQKKQRLEKDKQILSERDSYIRTIEQLKKAISHTNKGLTWRKEVGEFERQHIGSFGMQSYTETSHVTRYENKNAVINILIVEVYPKLNLRYSVSNFKGIEQVGYCSDSVKLDLINSSIALKTIFIKLAENCNLKAGIDSSALNLNF